MNSRLFLVLVVVMGMAGAVLLSCARVSDSELHVTKVASAGDDEAEKPAAPPPLVVDRDMPLLLDEPTETEKPSPTTTVRARADNTACFVCHANYKEELSAGQHAAAQVGCVDCHGKSYAHRNDENNTTPPDVMYPPDEIGPSCRQCHQRHDVPANQVVARWLERCSDKKDPRTIVCTDCHGQHRLKLRSVRWDKKTGQLVRRQKTENRRQNCDF